MADSDDITSRLKLDWSELYPQMYRLLASIYDESGQETLAQVDVGPESDAFSTVADSSIDYAKTRAAELIGMRVQEDGTLVPNPDAKWAITDTTRDAINRSVQNALEQGLSAGAFRDELMQDYAFSAQRALMVARTERNLAQRRGGSDAAKASGVVKRKRWNLSDSHPVEDGCDINAEAGWIDIDDEYPEGDNPHPSCECFESWDTSDGDKGAETEE